MADGIVTLTTQPSTRPSRSAKPVVVDFWAEWCGPCKMIAPILSEIAAEQADRHVAKLNVDENPDIAMRFNVMSIPTCWCSTGGEPKKRIVGRQGQGLALAGARRNSSALPTDRPVSRRGGPRSATPPRVGRVPAPSAPRRGAICASTERAVGSSRGLAACDPRVRAMNARGPTLVEATWRSVTGYSSARLPTMRGDDVADLQARLARLGFDCRPGRRHLRAPDGAVPSGEFQRNCGLPPDGVCGPTPCGS